MNYSIITLQKFSCDLKCCVSQFNGNAVVQANCTDLETHSAGIISLLNLSEVLLHDHDACPTSVEFNALQHVMRNLDQRWKSISSLWVERNEKLVFIDVLLG